MQTPSLLTRLSRKFAESRFLTTSLAIHFAVICGLSTIVVIEQTKPERPPIVGGLPPLESVETDPPDPAPDPVDSAPESPIKPMNVVHVVDQGIVLPAHNEIMTGDRFTAGPSAGGSFSDGPSSFGPATSFGDSRLPTIGGQPIKSAKLGVLLDISGSAHPFLHRPLREIEEGFQNAVVILYSGCGMKEEARKRDYDFKRGGTIKLGRMKEGKPKNVGEILDQAGMKNAELRNHLGQMLERPNLYGVEWSGNAAIFGAHFALQRLGREGVDAVYWFADFQDVLETELLQDLTKEMKRRGIKVYCHNFAGKFPNPRQEAAVRKFAEETGGKCILTIPGK